MIGLLFCLYLLWSITSAIWSLLYTCYLGNALGRSLNVKTLGTWAGEFIGLVPTQVLFYRLLLFSLWVIPTVLLFSFFLAFCAVCSGVSSESRQTAFLKGKNNFKSRELVFIDQTGPLDCKLKPLFISYYLWHTRTTCVLKTRLNRSAVCDLHLLGHNKQKNNTFPSDG